MRLKMLEACIARTPCWTLLVQAERRGPLHIPAEAVRNDFNETDLGRSDLGDLAFRRTHVIAGADAMDQAVLGLHQAEHLAAETQCADHPQRVERVLLEELAVALRRTQA